MPDPIRQLPGTTLRAPTAGEQLTDMLRSLFDSMSQQPVGRVADALGVSDLAGVRDSFDDPNTRDEFKIAMASRRRPMIGGAGARIPKGSQSQGMTLNSKLPRFRSPLGTFIKHEGEWWRVAKQPADSLNVTLERLPAGDELQTYIENGEKPPVLDTKTLSADELWQSHLNSRGLSDTPKRRR